MKFSLKCPHCKMGLSYAAHDTSVENFLYQCSEQCPIRYSQWHHSPLEMPRSANRSKPIITQMNFHIDYEYHFMVRPEEFMIFKLEKDQIKPWPHSLDNSNLLCRVNNSLEIDFDNLQSLKEKIKLWMTFS